MKYNTNQVIAVCALMLAFTTNSSAQSLFMKAKREGSFRGLVEDNTARSVGDILTIVIKEAHSVSQEDKTARSTKTLLSAQLESFKIKPSTFGSILPDFDVRSSRSYDGAAKQNRDQTFKARIAVVVKDRLPNGNLVVVGTRTIIVDNEVKCLKISGVIRTDDVKDNNTIDSDQVAEAKVSIKGHGKSTESVTRGPIGKALETAWWLIWPF